MNYEEIFNLEEEIQKVSNLVDLNIYHKVEINIKNWNYVLEKNIYNENNAGRYKKIYLLNWIFLTRYCEKLEGYVRELLVKYNETELNEFRYSRICILSCMMKRMKEITLNTFKMVFDAGINVNQCVLSHNLSPLHYYRIIYTGTLKESQHFVDIIKLCDSKGMDKSLRGWQDKPLFEEYVQKCNRLTDSHKLIIECFIQIGMTCENMSEIKPDVREFIESFNCKNIKPAKNISLNINRI